MDVLLTIALAIIITATDVHGLINGYKLSDREQPYIASICHSGWHSCTGIFINDVYILTLATCIITRPLAMMSVMVDRKTFGSCEGKTLTVKSYVVHPNYDGDANDVAVVQLHPWAFPHHLDFNADPIAPQYRKYCSMCHMFGWLPRNNKDQRVLARSPVHIFSRKRCAESGVDVMKKEFCFVDPTSRTIVTEGDEGAPIVCNGILVGMIKSSKKPHDTAGTRRYPTKMIALSRYEDWINDANSPLWT